MKKNTTYLQLILFLLFTNVVFLEAQVTIGSNADPNPNAILDLKNKSDETSDKGLVLPRVKLVATSDKAPLSANVAGMVVYNTNTSNDVTPGYYYNNGSKWVRIIDSSLVDASKDAWVNDPTNSMVKLATKSDEITARPAGTEVVVTDDGKIGIGTTIPNAKLDVRTSPTSTTDPGDGYIGIGTTSLAASTVGAGAIRYSSSSGGLLQYSNGTLWCSLISNVQRAIVISRVISSTQTFPNATGTAVTGWTDDLDDNNYFDNGIFTAPRDGVYLISFTFSFTSSNVSGASRVEAQLVSSVGTANGKKSVVAFPAAGTCEPGAAISFAVQMSAGETIKPIIWHNTGPTQQLKVGAGNEGYVNFSVVEL